jgi:hypothetical protein
VDHWERRIAKGEQLEGLIEIFIYNNENHSKI